MKKYLDLLTNLFDKNNTFGLGNSPMANKIRGFIIPSIALIITIALATTIIVPQTLQYLKAQSQLSGTQDQIQDLDQKITTLQNVQVDKYNQELVTALKAYPTEKDYLLAAAQLQSIAQKLNIKLSALSFGGSDTSSYQIRVNVVGSLDEITKFAVQVNQSPRVMKVVSFNLALLKTSLDATLDINAFYGPLSTEEIDPTKGLVLLNDNDNARLSKLNNSFNTAPSVYGIPTNQASGKVDPFE